MIVARSSWDAYVNEFIEVRGLTSDIGKLRKLGFAAKINRTFELIEAPLPDYETLGVWGDLEVLNRLRNKIVHELSKPYGIGESPGTLIEDLERREWTSPPGARLWEQAVLIRWTGCWACKVVGAAVLAMEGLPAKRRRALGGVERAVQQALSPLQT